ncbi:MAG: Mov34/MPN/PAD-1 family protein [Lachnospira sp.]
MVIEERFNRKIKICNQILRTICKYIQLQSSDAEAGGIIVGRENSGNKNVVLEYSTEPMKNDVRSRMKYLRKDIGHVEYFKKLYNENNGIYAYYGEWHTHPEDIPRYSLIDLANWKKIAKEDPKDIQYHIIAGRKYLTIWKMKKGFLIPDKICEVKWDEVFPKENSSK